MTSQKPVTVQNRQSGPYRDTFWHSLRTLKLKATTDCLGNLTSEMPKASPSHGRWSGGGGLVGTVVPLVFAKFLQNLPFLPQILAFLCLQPPHIPVSPRTFKFTPPSMPVIWLTPLLRPHCQGQICPHPPTNSTNKACLPTQQLLGKQM